jgi:hypothetical protein
MPDEFPDYASGVENLQTNKQLPDLRLASVVIFCMGLACGGYAVVCWLAMFAE